MSRYRGVSVNGAEQGVRTALGGFIVDRVVDESLERHYPEIRNKFELIAKNATRNIEEMFGTKVEYIFNLGDAIDSYFSRLKEFIVYQEKQIANLRSFLAGDAKKLVEERSAVPTSLSRDALALIGGADLDPRTNEASRDEEGNYFVEGIATLGLLYIGKKSLDLFSDDYEEEFGFSPKFRFTWVHTTLPNKELPAHGRLGGKTYTLQERPSVLSNDSVSWLGSTFYPSDHIGCNCIELPSLV